MKILFMGDANFSRLEKPLTREAAKELIAEVKPHLDRVDFRVVNMEEPMGDINKYEPIAKSGPNLISSAENICFYEELNTDIAVLANNHIGDYGEAATKDTIEMLDNINMKHIGAGKNIDEAYNAVVLEKDGVKVSVIAVCENEFGVATKNTYGSAGFNALRLFKKIQAEKALGNKVLIVFHGGDETNPVPSPDCVERYRLIIEFGADAIVAGHTHCPQGYEYYNGKPIVYSLGNFVFQTGSGIADGKVDLTRPWFYGYMAMLEATNEGISIAEVIPYRFNYPLSRVTVFQGEEKQKMLDYLKEISDVIQDEEFMQKHYEGWVTMGFQWRVPGDPREETEQRKLCAYKNLVTCEAHNSYVRQAYKLFMNHKFEEAAKQQDDITKISKMPV